MNNYHDQVYKKLRRFQGRCIYIRCGGWFFTDYALLMLIIVVGPYDSIPHIFINNLLLTLMTNPLVYFSISISYRFIPYGGFKKWVDRKGVGKLVKRSVLLTASFLLIELTFLIFIVVMGSFSFSLPDFIYDNFPDHVGDVNFVLPLLRFVLLLPFFLLMKYRPQNIKFLYVYIDKIVKKIEQHKV